MSASQPRPPSTGGWPFDWCHRPWPVQYCGIQQRMNPSASGGNSRVVEQSTRIYRGMCYGCVERDESEVGGRIYPSFEVVAATHHRFDTPRRLRPFAMVPPPAPHNSGTAGVPARATVPVEPPYSTCPARAEGPRPPINQDQCEHHFTKLRQEPNGVVQVLLDQKAAGATRGQWSCCRAGCTK